MLLSTFLELSRTQPDLGAVIPHPAPDVGLTTTRLPDVNGVLNGDGDCDHDGDPFPPQLGGLSHVAVPGSPPGVAIYGSGLSRFVLLPLPTEVGMDALNSAIQAGADSVALPGTPGGQAATQAGVLIRTPLLSVLMVRAGFRHAVFLFAGAVTPAVLENSAGALVTDLSQRHRFPR